MSKKTRDFLRLAGLIALLVVVLTVPVVIQIIIWVPSAIVEFIFDRVSGG